MKKLALFLAATSLVALTSCDKCTDCSCTYSSAYTFETDFSSTEEANIRSEYNQYGAATYPETSEEICDKRGDFDNTIAAYEEKSATFTDDGTREGKAWSVLGTYTCSCDK